jgi:hypothetical protein
MLELLFAIETAFTSLWVWVLLFIFSSGFQFLLAQRLHHHQVWFALVPILKSVQWFEMGRTSKRYLLALIPLVLIILWPISEGHSLQTVMITVKVLLGLQIALFILYYWFKAARIITQRAGERSSFSVWLLMPVIGLMALGRLALKKTYWVSETKEKSLISKIIHGIEGDHKISTLKKYASSHGFNAHDFEIVSDKALTIKNNHLKVSAKSGAVPACINFAGLVVGLLLVLILAGIYINKASSFFNQTVNTPEIALEKSPSVPVKSEPTVKVKPIEQTQIAVTAPNEFVFLMEVDSFDTSIESTVYNGSIAFGDAMSREASRFYLLDKNYKLIDSVRVLSVSGLFGSYKVETRTVLDPEKVAYIAETRTLRDRNALGATRTVNTSESVLVIAQYDQDSQAKNRSVFVSVKRDRLYKEENLYVYDKNLNLVNEAEIVYLISPQKSSVDFIEPTDGVELVVEFDQEYTGQEYYLSPLREVDLFRDYITVLNL